MKRLRSHALPAAAAAAALLLWASAAGAARVVVLGIDGLDPRLLRQYMDDGSLPNFSRLAAQGGFSELQTAAAAQSPVAWSTFITGADPGGHGIFDFVHRDPATMTPYLSMSRARKAERSLRLGPWALPLEKPRVELLRKGKAFWEILGEAGVPTTLFRMPVNFPPLEVPLSRQVSGMGTPDLLGTSGTFSLFTEVLPRNAGELTGGKAFRVEADGDAVDMTVTGPDNPFRSRPEPLLFPFRAYLDREHRTAKFEVGGREFVLAEGEWSEWVPIRFRAVPLLVTVPSTARFFLKQVSPHFELYVSPLQIDPEDPVMPVSFPADFSAKLCSCLGYFYTQELPHDTKAFTYGVFSGRDFWDQLTFLDDEARRAFDCLFREHREGLLFFYFGSVDQGSHMLWHFTDREHPFFSEDRVLAEGIRGIYRRMDDLLGSVLDSVGGETTVIVMSDHGFAPFYWGVNLNTWLLRKGYIALKPGVRPKAGEFFSGVDWGRTTAYALGLNGLYLNVKGRELGGIVEGGARYEAFLDRLEADLLAMRDPRTGRQVVTRLTRPGRDFQGPYRHEGPDLIIGYGWGYRSSWESPLGGFPREVFTDNLTAWSGDHCIDHTLVPGVLLANRAVTMEAPSLPDLTVSILDEFGLAPPPEMTGRDCLGAKPARPVAAAEVQ